MPVLSVSRIEYDPCRQGLCRTCATSDDKYMLVSELVVVLDLVRHFLFLSMSFDIRKFIAVFCDEDVKTESYKESALVLYYMTIQSSKEIT